VQHLRAPVARVRSAREHDRDRDQIALHRRAGEKELYYIEPADYFRSSGIDEKLQSGPFFLFNHGRWSADRGHRASPRQANFFKQTRRSEMTARRRATRSRKSAIPSFDRSI
jgi:hypothetical protein